MPRYLIELPHENEHAACVKALRVVERYGAHLLTQADWGCKFDRHCGWLIVGVDSLSEAELLVPPELRQEARIVETHKFTRDDIASLITELEGSAESP